MQEMMQWETLIHDTVLIGGRIIFLKDDAPADISEWLKPIVDTFSLRIPCLLKNADDFLIRKFHTNSQDLIFIFENQKHHLLRLNSILQGQRVMLCQQMLNRKDETIDFVWPLVNLSKWQKMMQELNSKWEQLPSLVEFNDSFKSPCLFLDRDDVVIKNVPYNNDPKNVQLMPGIENLISNAHAQGYWVSLVTNQSGLGRGRISWSQYQQVHQRMLQLLAEKNCWFDECIWAAYIDEEAVPSGRFLAGLRKPRSGMFQMVNSKLKINMGHSFMVGDSASDLIAAYSAGVGNLYLFDSGRNKNEQAELVEFAKLNKSFNFEIIADLAAINV